MNKKLPHSSLEDTVRKYIGQYGMIQKGDRIAAGVSGGADSRCLLFLLHRFSQEMGFSLEIVHVEHGIRGSESVEDAAYVKNICEKLSLPCRIVSLDIPELAKKLHLSVEEAGRKARYAAFNETDPDKIAVAHNMGDTAETLLFNLFRGSGIKGAASIQPMNGKVIRPLLSVGRADIEAYCRSNRIVWRTDSTNAEMNYARNRIRLNILPEAEKVNPEAVKHLFKAAQHFQRAETFLAKCTDECFHKYACKNKEGGLRLRLDLFKNEESLLISRTIQLCINEVLGSAYNVTEKHIEDVRALMDRQSGKSASLPDGAVAVREFGEIVFYPPSSSIEKHSPPPAPAEIPLPEGGQGRISLPDGNSYNFSIEDPPDPMPAAIPNLKYTKWLDYDKISGGAVFRTRRSGDYITIRSGRKKLKDLFIAEKIPAAERSRLYMLADGNHIIWIPNLRISEECKISAQTRRVLKIEGIIKDPQ